MSFPISYSHFGSDGLCDEYPGAFLRTESGSDGCRFPPIGKIILNEYLNDGRISNQCECLLSVGGVTNDAKIWLGKQHCLESFAHHFAGVAESTGGNPLLNEAVEVPQSGLHCGLA